jgi:hypothetical protein
MVKNTSCTGCTDRREAHPAERFGTPRAEDSVVHHIGISSNPLVAIRAWRWRLEGKLSIMLGQLVNGNLVDASLGLLQVVGVPLLPFQVVGFTLAFRGDT